MADYEITTDPTRFDLAAIHAFLTTSYWSRGISRALVERAIANSICFGALHNGEQVGFARVITDRATFAYLADVYVVESHRGRGLAQQIMTAITQHADLQGLRRMMLVTRDAHGLYAKYGFTALEVPERVMERTIANAYASPDDASPER
jgi:N-acetylglutamate synthase-like GNAT family acetyltransferase